MLGNWLKNATIEEFIKKMPRQPLDIKSDYINVLLDVASERTRYRGSQVYEVELGLSIRDLRLLRMVGAAPGISMGELVQQSGIEKTLASKHVSALVQRGWVERHVGQADARQVVLSLTDEGEALVLKAEPLGHEMESRFRDVLTPAEIAALRRMLLKLIAAEAGSRDIFDFLVARLRESKSDAARPSSRNAR